MYLSSSVLVIFFFEFNTIAFLMKVFKAPFRKAERMRYWKKCWTYTVVEISSTKRHSCCSSRFFLYCNNYNDDCSRATATFCWPLDGHFLGKKERKINAGQPNILNRLQFETPLLYIIKENKVYCYFCYTSSISKLHSTNKIPALQTFAFHCRGHGCSDAAKKQHDMDRFLKSNFH